MQCFSSRAETALDKADHTSDAFLGTRWGSIWPLEDTACLQEVMESRFLARLSHLRAPALLHIDGSL